MKKVIRHLQYASLLSLFFILSLLHLRVLYVLSDILAWLVADVIGYRRRVVLENLASSFPTKSPEEIERIARKFYGFLTDYFVETVKLTTMSRRQMIRRMRFEGIQKVDATLRDRRDVVLYLGHYCNWEWVSSLPLHLTPGALPGQIYHPLESPAADRLFLRLRGRWGAISVRLHETLRVIARWRRDGTTSIVGYIADQVPGYNGIHCWIDFLNHDTPVYSGPERIARMQHAEVYYLDISRPRRGQYIGRFIRITPDAAREPQFFVTREYFRLLQQSICNHPQYWLWSHRRWKRTRAEFMAKFLDAEDRLKRL